MDNEKDTKKISLIFIALLSFIGALLSPFYVLACFDDCSWLFSTIFSPVLLFGIPLFFLEIAIKFSLIFALLYFFRIKGINKSKAIMVALICVLILIFLGLIYYNFINPQGKAFRFQRNVEIGMIEEEVLALENSIVPGIEKKVYYCYYPPDIYGRREIRYCSLREGDERIEEMCWDYKYIGNICFDIENKKVIDKGKDVSFFAIAFP